MRPRARLMAGSGAPPMRTGQRNIWTPSSRCERWMGSMPRWRTFANMVPSTPIASSPKTRGQPSAFSLGSTAPSSCTMPRPSSPMAASLAWAPKSASPPAGCTRADQWASSNSPHSSMSCAGRAKCGQASAQHGELEGTRELELPGTWALSSRAPKPVVFDEQLGRRPARSAAPFFFTPVASAFDQAHDGQQDHRTDDGIDHFGNEPATDIEPNARQEPAGNHRTDDADDDIADQSKSPTLYNLTGEPAGDGTDNEPDNDGFRRHGLSFPLGRELCSIALAPDGP